MSEENTQCNVGAPMLNSFSSDFKYRAVSVDFVYRIGTRVWIKAIQAEALVNGLFLEVPGWPQYRVRYWHNGEWKETYLPGSELEPLKMKTGMIQESAIVSAHLEET